MVYFKILMSCINYATFLSLHSSNLITFQKVNQLNHK